MRRPEDIRTQLQEFRGILPPVDTTPIPGDFAMKLQMEAWRMHEDELERELVEAEQAERQKEQPDGFQMFSQRDPGRKNVLAGDVEIRGSLRFTGELTIDGKIEGEILSEGTLIVGKTGDIRGEVRTRSVTVVGNVNGNIVTERCELKASAFLRGDLKASRLVIEEGATFVGRSEARTGKIARPMQIASAQTSPEPSPEKKVAAMPLTV